MREIKFRGKDYNDNWIYGWLSGPNTIHFEPANKYKWTAESVLPETVGQFTGVQDENAKDVYEGDIVKFKPSLSMDARKCIGRVRFRQAEFILDSEDYHSLNRVYEIRVVGNIYDNPEFI